MMSIKEQINTKKDQVQQLQIESVRAKRELETLQGSLKVRTPNDTVFGIQVDCLVDRTVSGIETRETVITEESPGGYPDTTMMSLGQLDKLIEDLQHIRHMYVNLKQNE